MTLEFRPIASAFGAEVLGVDPSRPLDADTQQQLRAAFDKYRLLLFRDAKLDSAQQAQLGEVFGPHAPQPPVPEAFKTHEANTQYVSNTRTDGILPTGELTYHHDHLYDPEPVRSIMLYGVEVPSAGGATKFRSCADTYKRLESATRALAETVRCLHLFDYNGVTIDGDPSEEKRMYFSLDTVTPGAPRTWQPLVWRDPRGGDPVVWVNYGSVVAFEGVGFAEGQQLLSDIIDVAAEGDEYVHQWRAGDALIWNNLHLQHARTPFDGKERRSLRRTTLM